MPKDDLLPRLTRVIELMTKQLHKLTQKELMILLKSAEALKFFETIGELEAELEVDHPFFHEKIGEIRQWQEQLPGGLINVERDFITSYAKANKYVKAEMREKVLYNQPQRMKATLTKFFQLLEAAIVSNQNHPLEKFANHLLIPLEDLIAELDRVNWDDRDIAPPDEPETDELTPPIHIERDFFRYYHAVDRLTKKDIQERATRGIPSQSKEKMEQFFGWLDVTSPEDNPPFAELVKNANMHPQELIRWLDRINWSSD